MYRTEEEKVVVDDEEITLYGIADENRFYCSFTRSKKVADEFAEFLNKNCVASCHVADVIEDTFYSGV